MRDYSKVVERTEALSHRDFRIEVLDSVAGYPVFCVTLGKDPSLPAIYINGGTHGDEPAGTEGALAFLETGCEQWLDRFRFFVIPCLNPCGYVHNTRSNAQDVDVNWAFLRDDVPEIGLLKRFIRGRKFAAVMDLHEDWESPGYYLYEQVRGLVPAGPSITNQVSRFCPLNTRTTIEGETALNGVIFPNPEVEKRRLGGGVPIVLFKQSYTDRLITSETPSTLAMEVRVQAHLVALETMLEVQAGG
ncbi:MAG: M14 family metallocarboxypeptidase [Gemmatimonadota bacterium]|nr:M14 family metallocarboxypeptidase [Gemmatimonadota bacterium]